MERQGTFFDRSAWPICVVRFLDRPWTDEDVDLFIAELRHTYDQNEPHAQIVEARINHLMNAGQRQKLVDYINEVKPQVENLLVSMGLIINSGMVRGAFTAVTWVVKPYWDLKIVANGEQAMEHVVEKLSERGIELNALQRLLLRASLQLDGDEAEEPEPSQPEDG